VREFWLCFVPLFVAVDAIGLVPMYLGLTEGIEPARLRGIVWQSVATAASVATAFLAFGPALLRSLGITVPDFMIAGGALLFAISLSDLITGEKRLREIDPATIGAVPLGVPLIAGPAVLTTCVVLADAHGRLLTAAAVLANIALAGVAFRFAGPITHRLGRTGTKAVSKVASVVLAAIGVMLVRRGIAAAILAAG